MVAEARATADSELEWSIPTAKTDRAFNWGKSAIAPDAVGKLLADGLHVPFYLEHELRARHPKGVLEIWSESGLGGVSSYTWGIKHSEE